MSGLRPQGDHKRARAKLFIDGRWVHASDGGTRGTIDPADGSVLAVVDEATPDDAADAIAAARRAFDDGNWPATPVSERIALLLRIADLLERDKDDIARIETLDTGKTLAESGIDVDDVVAVFRYYAQLIGDQTDRTVDVDDPDVVSKIVHEPIGVCVMIAPWNYPLLQISWKIAPALAAGCTMVVKPSEVTPLSTVELFRVLEEAGVPAGVANLVLGAGAAVGPALTDTDDVDLISFTGGLASGTTVATTAARHMTRVATELGGKNPHIVFADTDRSIVVDQVLTGVFLHSGQVCSAGTRLIVEESIADDVVADLVARASRIRLGAGMDSTSECGPLVSAQQLDKVERFVALGVSEGARLVTGGARPDDAALRDGYFYLPTIFDGCDASMRIVQQETFGPILTVERFTTEAEAIALGNDTDYGLAAGVHTGDRDRGERVARALRHGTVWIDDFGYYTPAAEWGGYKKSGNGRELGPSGLAEYQEQKHIWRNTRPKPAGWFTSSS